MSLGTWFVVGFTKGRLFVGPRSVPRSFAPLPRKPMAQRNEDEADRKQAEALRSSHPRAHDPNYRARMVMLEDEPRPLAERGTELAEFIDPDELGPIERKRARHRFRYGD